MKGTIVFVSGSLNLSGADFSMYAVIKKLKQEGYDTLIILPKECKSSEFWRKKKIRYLTVPFKIWITPKVNWLYQLIKHNAKKIYNNYQLNKNFELIKQNTKNILCIYNNGFTNDFAVNLAKKLKKPCVYHLREFGDLDFKWNFEKGSKIKQYDAIEKNVNLFIAISDVVRQSFSGVRNIDKIKVVYNGIETTEIKQNDEKSDLHRIVISGRLVDGKGHLILLKALKKIIESDFKNVRLDIYGDGELKEKIISFINENALNEYVNLKGFVLGIDYQQYEIGITASRAEAFGRVTVEYMMNGLVTIASNSGANPEIINNYKDGILFNNNDEDDLKEKILEVIKSEKLRKEISSNAIRKAREKFSEESYVNNIFDLLLADDIIKN